MSHARGGQYTVRERLAHGGSGGVRQKGESIDGVAGVEGLGDGGTRYAEGAEKEEEIWGARFMQESDGGCTLRYRAESENERKNYLQSRTLCS
jgi:hypothetical protein